MKNYKVKATVNFPDKTTHQRRLLGEEFICTEERYNELKFKNVIKLVEIIEENDEIDTIIGHRKDDKEYIIPLSPEGTKKMKEIAELIEKNIIKEEIVEKKPRKRKTSKK